ncbi:testis-expressed protein 2-like isoform X2 [Amphiura filiformis]|uniref:testis-expressed protein 2-like isoform X2 n=1 Tax=Amphiura filiformis TaxID=82378 RepID=UPI003B21F8E1
MVDSVMKRTFKDLFLLLTVTLKMAKLINPLLLVSPQNHHQCLLLPVKKLSQVLTLPKEQERGNDSKGSLSSKELEDLIDSFGDPKPSASFSKKKPSAEAKPIKSKSSPLEEKRPTVVDRAPSLDSRTPSIDEKSSLGERTNSAGSLNEYKTKEESKALNKPVEKVRQQSFSNSHSAPSLNRVEKEKPAKPFQKPLKPVRSLSGLVTVSNEVLQEEEGLPELPKDSMTDPLSFLDKFMDDDEEDEFVPIRSQKKPPLAEKKRAKSLDCEKFNSVSNHAESEPLNIEQFYYSIPTPSEVKDVPVRSNSDSQSLGRTPPEMSLTLSGLLSSHRDESEAAETYLPPRNESPPSVSSPDFIKQDIDSDKELSDLGDIYSPSTPKSPESVDETGTESPKSELLDLEYTPPGLFLSVTTMFIFALLVFPLPASLSGFFAGMAFAFYLILFVVWLSVPQLEREYRELEDPNTLPPLQIPGPKLTASKVRAKEQGSMLHKGWMNELSSPYDPENYHIAQTHSLYVRLDQYKLRLSRPKYNIPRRAMYDETVIKPEFIHQRHYDMRGSKVYLLPEGLVKKRLWSKKYPICIELPKKGVSVEKKDPEQVRMADLDAQEWGFDVVKKEECDDQVLYLFARTGREKEEWFWKFELASKFQKVKGYRPIPTLYKKVFLTGNELTEIGGNQYLYRAEPDDPNARKGTVDFYKFVSKVIPKEKDTREAPPQVTNVKTGSVTYASPARKQTADLNSACVAESPVSWINAFVGRLFWDFLREEYWADVVKGKLQKKLSKLKIPFFIDELKITEIDMGLYAPTLRRASKPRIDEQGMWVDLDIAYQGSCCMTLSTKVNLWRLAKDGGKIEKEMEDLHNIKREAREKEDRKPPQHYNKPTTGEESSVAKAYRLNRQSSSAALDSDEEDSAESSDDELPDEAFPTGESQSTGLGDIEGGMKSSSKLLRFVNKITHSEYFQKATQYKYVKRAFDGVSNTPVELTVEVKELRGTLTLNIPPPPTDRLWYGFRGKPYLWLSAKPKLGTRQVTITHITDYIEKKLELEFQKVFVLPNMDDLPIPVMHMNFDECRF